MVGGLNCIVFSRCLMEMEEERLGYGMTREGCHGEFHGLDGSDHRGVPWSSMALMRVAREGCHGEFRGLAYSKHSVETCLWIGELGLKGVQIGLYSLILCLLECTA